MRVGTDTSGKYMWILRSDYEVLKEDHKHLQELLDRLVDLTGAEDYEDALYEVENLEALQVWI